MTTDVMQCTGREEDETPAQDGSDRWMYRSLNKTMTGRRLPLREQFTYLR